jgi:hypothetical protein
VKATAEKERCAYCAGDTAKIVCKDCRLVQWSRLEAMGPRMLLAGFIAVHRWQAMAAAISFVLAGAIALGGRANERDRSRREARLTAARRVSEAGSAFRSALLMMEATCDEPRSPGCAKSFDALRDNYFRYSWEAPSVIWDLRRICGRADHSGEPSRAAICALARTCNYEKLIDRLNGDFRAYVNELATCRCAAAPCVDARRRLADVLYENGRNAQCAIAEVAYDVTFFGDDKPFSTYYGCEHAVWRDAAGGAGACPAGEAVEPRLHWREWPSTPPTCAAAEAGGAANAAAAAPAARAPVTSNRTPHRRRAGPPDIRGSRATTTTTARR